MFAPTNGVAFCNCTGAFRGGGERSKNGVKRFNSNSPSSAAAITIATILLVHRDATVVTIAMIIIRIAIAIAMAAVHYGPGPCAADGPLKDDCALAPSLPRYPIVAASARVAITRQ